MKFIVEVLFSVFSLVILDVGPSSVKKVENNFLIYKNKCNKTRALLYITMSFSKGEG